MCDVCGDNRFELIEKYKKALMEATNIEDSKDEMAVIDNILFRFWQMGWLDKLDAPTMNVGKCQKCQYSETSNEIDYWCRNWEACVDIDGYCYEWAKKGKNDE